MALLAEASSSQNQSDSGTNDYCEHRVSLFKEENMHTRVIHHHCHPRHFYLPNAQTWSKKKKMKEKMKEKKKKNEACFMGPSSAAVHNDA